MQIEYILIVVAVAVGALLIKLFSATRSESPNAGGIPSISGAELLEVDRTPRRSPQGEQEVEAQRLARLLVSELELYNEENIELGRRRGDLYPRLHEDIEHSRKVYFERVAPEVEVDFFLRELIDVVAGGDVNLFGLEEQSQRRAGRIEF